MGRRTSSLARMGISENMPSSANVNPDFWKGRNVLVTGHTGFKGSWAILWLAKMGANITGISLEPESKQSHFSMIRDEIDFIHNIIDIRDKVALENAINTANPEIVLHMAAQALVRRSYRSPIETYETNVIGTANLLECLKSCQRLQAVLSITSDKVYKNDNDGRAFVETDPLGGDDPYSASKAAAEIVTASYAKSYFRPANIPVATGRAGNVIGGGDFSEDRLIPDIYRAADEGNPVVLRHPESTRPWQHVLESLSGYFLYLEALANQPVSELPSALNFGPLVAENLTVGEIASEIQKTFGITESWSRDGSNTPPEKALLSINAELARKTLDWHPRWNTAQTLDKTAGWYTAFKNSEDMYLYSLSQIKEYETIND